MCKFFCSLLYQPFLDANFYVACFLTCLFLVACFVIPMRTTDVIKHSWDSGEITREEKRTSCCFAAHFLSNIPAHKENFSIAHTGSDPPIKWQIMTYLICGNRGSSDEGRDGGLCDHAVGGDAVRRGVETEKREHKEPKWKKLKPSQSCSNYIM